MDRLLEGIFCFFMFVSSCSLIVIAVVMALTFTCSEAKAHHTSDHTGYQIMELKREIECQKFLVRDPMADVRYRCP